MYDSLHPLDSLPRVRDTVIEEPISPVLELHKSLQADPPIVERYAIFQAAYSILLRNRTSLIFDESLLFHIFERCIPPSPLPRS